MIENLIYLTVLTIFLLSIVSYTAATDIQMLAVVNAFCVVSDPLLGYTVPVGFGYQGDIGTIFFSVSMYGLALKCLLYGRNQIHRAVRHILYALAVSLGAIVILGVGGLLPPEVSTRLQAECTRFFLFWAVQTFFVHLQVADLGIPRLLQISAANLLLLTLDAIVFFPAAYFGIMPMHDIVPMMITGVLMRGAVTVLAIPFLSVLLWLKRQGRVPVPGPVVVLDADS